MTTTHATPHATPEPRVNARRAMSLGARVACGTAWAMCLTVLGLSLMLDGPPVSWMGANRGAWVLLGLASAAAGVLVFMAMVADRLVPHVGRRMTMFPIEMAMFALLVGGFAAAILILSKGTPS